jgi:hypothetical protein
LPPTQKINGGKKNIEFGKIKSKISKNERLKEQGEWKIAEKIGVGG